MLYCFVIKQKTAYEMLRSLVGSEMCIGDRLNIVNRLHVLRAERRITQQQLADAVGFTLSLIPI